MIRSYHNYPSDQYDCVDDQRLSHLEHGAEIDEGHHQHGLVHVDLDEASVVRGLPPLQGGCQGEEGEVEGDKRRGQSGGVEREAFQAEEDEELQKQEERQKGVQNDDGGRGRREVQ